LRAGAAFFLLDPSAEVCELSREISTVNPRILIETKSSRAMESLVSRINHSACRQLVLAEQIKTESSSLPTENPGIELPLDSSAYVATTRDDQGVLIEYCGTHRSIAQTAKWTCDTLEVQPFDKLCLLSDLCHNRLPLEVFTSLYAGSTLWIPGSSDLTSDQLPEWLNDKHVSIIFITPGAWRSVGPTLLAFVRHICFMSDVLVKEDVRKLRKLAPFASCSNLYSASGSVDTWIYHKIDCDETQLREIIPLGQAGADSQLIILNAAGAKTGIGELGEICIRSRYFHETWTSSAEDARFLRNPLSAAPDDWLFRT